MRVQVEARMRCPDYDGLRSRAIEIGSMYEGKDDQTDTYFGVPDGFMKIRETSLDQDHVLFYRRPNIADIHTCESFASHVTEIDSMRALLENAFGTRAVIRKTRETFVRQNCRILFDRLSKNRTFLTVRYDLGPGETPEEATRELETFLEAFDCDRTKRLAQSYCEIAG